MTLPDILREHHRKKDSGPLWKGPESPSDLGGITFSMLSDFMVCRERFRLKYMEGYRTEDEFNHRIEYGQMWHVCEEAHASGLDFQGPLESYVAGLVRDYPHQQEEIRKWWRVCSIQFPQYVEFWQDHPDVAERVPVFQEKVFCIPYVLPSGRTVFLRGKFDGVDIVPREGVYLQENKTKGSIYEGQLRSQLEYDMQTMLYLVTLERYRNVDKRKHVWKTEPIRGVIYNVIRRPLSGGKGTIVRHKATRNKPEETWDHYFGRLAGVIMDDREHYFLRWKVEVLPHEVRRFEKQTLIPLLEQACEWYDCQKCCPDPYRCGHARHWVHPFGIYSALQEGGTTPYDALILTGSIVGLTRTDRLFTELEE